MQATTQSGSVGIKYPALEIVSQQMVYRNFSRNELGISSELPKLSGVEKSHFISCDDS